MTGRINILHGAEGVSVWQRNYYEHIIRGEDELVGGSGKSVGAGREGPRTLARVKPETIPVAASWYLVDLGEARASRPSEDQAGRMPGPRRAGSG